MRTRCPDWHAAVLSTRCHSQITGEQHGRCAEGSRSHVSARGIGVGMYMSSPSKHFPRANPQKTGRHSSPGRPGQQAPDGGDSPCRHGRRPRGSQARGGGRAPRKLIALGFVAALMVVALARVFAVLTAGSPSVPVVWEAASSSVANLAAVSPSLAAADPGAPGTLIQSTARITRNPVRPGYQSMPTERWASEARFAADVAAGAIPSYIQVAHYDNEKWSQTPLVEQQHPALYEMRFCQLAHAHGLLCATGPARDLCPVAFPRSGSLDNCYLSNDLAGDAARYADYTDIQGQVNELRGTSAYAAFIASAAAQAKAANPRNITLGNLSATPAGRSVSPSAMSADARAAFGADASHVAGFYLTITNAGAATTAQFLQLFNP